MPCSVQFSKYGDIDVVRVVDVPALSPDAEHVRIAVRAAGINPIDWKTVQGLMREEFTLTLPAGLGTDVAGVVDQVGADVTEFRAGDAVMGASLTPSFAEFAIADPANLIKKPAAINWEVAGSVAGAGGTAYAVLNKLGVHATDTLLIHAAAGGVGTFAVQLAVARGTRVIGRQASPISTTCVRWAPNRWPTATGFASASARSLRGGSTPSSTHRAAVKSPCRSPSPEDPNEY